MKENSATNRSPPPLTQEYAHGKTDEFLPPLIFALPNEQRVRDGDVVFFFNFRADRARQLSQAFIFPDFKGFDRRVQPKVHYVTMTEYDETYGVPFAFAPASFRQHPGGSRQPRREKAAPDRRDGEVSARHLLL